MKFRTSIWMLPISAAVVFIVGMIASFVVNEHTSDRFTRLATVDSPYVEELAKLALVAQHHLRHKTSKPAFMQVFG